MRQGRAALSGAESQSREDLFWKGDQLLERGQYRAAFRAFLTAARAGDASCQLNVGYLYGTGKGVTKDRAKALYWYRRAYAKRSSAAAHNIGMIFRSERRWKLALLWFERSVQLGDDDSHGEMAKIKLQLGDRGGARLHLQAVLDSDSVTENSLEEAQALLRTLEVKDGWSGETKRRARAVTPRARLRVK